MRDGRNEPTDGNAGARERVRTLRATAHSSAFPCSPVPPFPSLGFNQASSHRVGGGLDAATHTQLPVDALEMVADGVWTQHELPADRGDIGTARDELQNLQFAARKGPGILHPAAWGYRPLPGGGRGAWVHQPSS